MIDDSAPENTSEPMAAMDNTALAAFDPLRMTYVEGLRRRAERLPQRPRERLLARAQEVLASLISDYRQALAVAVARVDEARQRVSLGSNQIDEWLASGDLRAVHQALDRLDRPETAARRSPANSEQVGAILDFQRTWQHHQTERLILRLLSRQTPDAGPLNPERLVTQSLKLMQAISPRYTRQIMDHTTALLWLEAASGQLSS